MILYFHGELEKNSGWRHKSCYCKFIYLFDDILFFKVSGQCLSQLPIDLLTVAGAFGTASETKA